MTGDIVQSANAPIRLTTPLLVLAPLAVLSTVFGTIVLAVWFSEDYAFVSPQSLIISGVLLYATTIFALGTYTRREGADVAPPSIVDMLTGLPNRRALHNDFAGETNQGEEVALALLDLDGFKQVNDHFGHIFGDQLIARASEILSRLCGNEARCYRLGGDEFAVMKRGPVAGTIVESICRKIIEELAKPIQMEDRAIAVGVSIGISRSTGMDGLTSSELLRRSDVAMYASKRGGKMRCTWFSTDFDRNREAVRELDNELREALANEEFRLFYQPLVDADSHKIVAVESLLRWERPDGQQIGPNIFIPVAEESGLINAIGLWVLRRACTDALAFGNITLSVNISAAQLRNPEFPIQLGYILEETGFPAERLDLEVTETCLVLDPVFAERSLNVIREFGVNVSLDDFGTGYASIGFLRQFRFEKLKLDRSLVVKAGEDDGSRAMMLSSIAMARALKMGVTAEGVETEEQATLVRTAGCDQIQGWLYYKAMPFTEVQGLIDAQQQDNIASMQASQGNAA